MNLQNLTVNPSGPLLLLIVYAFECAQVKYGVRSPKFIWAPCVQLYFLAETPRSPHLGSYTRALSVSLDRRHLFVTPLASCLFRHYVYVTHTENIKSFDFNRRTGEIYWTSPALGMIGRQAKTDRDSLKRPNATVWLTGIDRLAFPCPRPFFAFSNLAFLALDFMLLDVFWGTFPSLFGPIPLGHH
jgi:hypothetical protein